MANQQHLFSFMEPVAPSHHALESHDAPEAAVANGVHSEVVVSPPASLSDLSENAAFSSENAASPPKKTGSSSEKARESRGDAIRRLRAKVGCISTAVKGSGDHFSTGCEAIDAWLPLGGLSPSSLTEWIAAHDSAAAATLALSAAAGRLHQIHAKPLVIVDCQGTFYPPAAVALGIPCERVILLRPGNAADALWSIDQSLRSAAVAAVWASLPMKVDDRDARRLQLAAETGRTPGLLVRDFAARGKPSFAEVQFYVSQHSRSASRQFRETLRRDFETISVTLDRVRGGLAGRGLTLQIDDQAVLRPLSETTSTRDNRQHETAAEHLASQLAHPKTARTASKRDRRFAS